jgi:hypothetical protein
MEIKIITLFLVFMHKIFSFLFWKNSDFLILFNFLSLLSFLSLIYIFFFLFSILGSNLKEKK